MEWLLNYEVMERLGFYGANKRGTRALAQILNHCKDREELPEAMCKKFGKYLFFSSDILDNKELTDILTSRGKKLAARRHDVVQSKAEQLLAQSAEMPDAKPVDVELTDKTLEEYDVPYSKAEKDYNEFCVKAMDVYLHDWEEQTDFIVKRLSYIYCGDASSVPRILHELHDDVERYAGVSFDQLKNGKEDSSIKCIRRDKRLQYYFLRSAREMAFKNGVIYAESI